MTARARAIYLGDEIAAAGWRLAGVAAMVPSPGNETAALAAAIDADVTASADKTPAARLVLLSAAVAARIDAAVLRAATQAPSPLVLVVPDTQGVASLPSLAARLRVQLGLEASVRAP